MRFAASLTCADGRYIAHCLEVDIAGEGSTREDAIANLKRELEVYMKETPAVAPPSDPKIGPVEVVITESGVPWS